VDAKTEIAAWFGKRYICPIAAAADK
jgi:hypothetical protein